MNKNDKKYKITILNWNKYQREMKGGENRRRRREWIAISVDLFSDPDYLALDATHSRLWLGLLLHSGKVGPVFTLSPSYARHLFDLRRSCDFSILKNQGFIDLHTATNKTVQDKQDKQDNSGQLALTSRFEEWWKCYPKKVKKADAMKKWKVKKLDAKADTLIADVANRIANDSQWAGGFIPHPTTYLNGERWNDEISVDTTKKLSYAENLAKDMRDKGML